jgi:hypothetical protein
MNPSATSATVRRVATERRIRIRPIFYQGRRPPPGTSPVLVVENMRAVT